MFRAFLDETVGKISSTHTHTHMWVPSRVCVFDENDDLAVGSVTKRKRKRQTHTNLFTRLALFIFFYQKPLDRDPTAAKILKN